MKCSVCGIKLTSKNRFKYENEKHQWIETDVCNKTSCIDALADSMDSEPSIDYEERWTDAKDQLWEESALYKEA